ncbi:MAG: methionyl-tRNA formyltransferase [Patescibacteria group bacterium]
MTTSTVRLIFFGSTDDSVIVLSRLHQLEIGNWKLEIACVVTQPPRAVGREQIITPTPVEVWAKAHHIPVLSFASHSEKSWAYADEEQVVDALEPFKADLIISACYGQRIPAETINKARFGGLNVHPSLLPRWRGADPVPWAILVGDHQTGVTVVTLSEKFDEGSILAQKKLAILDTDTSDALRTKLFTMGADLLFEVFSDVLSMKRITKNEVTNNNFSYARRFTRDDGFEPWETLQKAFADPTEAQKFYRKFRAFDPWPGVWTTVKVKSEKKRLKIIACHVDTVSGLFTIDTVQREGKNPVSWTQFQNAYLPS